MNPSIHGWCSVCFCDCPFLVFSWSQADSEKTKSALWPLMIGELFSFENNWLCEGNCCWKKVTISWKGSKFVDLYIKEKLNKFLGLQVTQLFWGRVVRAKSRQRKRHRLNVVLIKNYSLSKKYFLVRIFPTGFPSRGRHRGQRVFLWPGILSGQVL